MDGHRDVQHDVTPQDAVALRERVVEPRSATKQLAPLPAWVATAAAVACDEHAYPRGR